MSTDCHALLIGVRQYPYLNAPLGGPGNDLILIGTLLRDRFDFPEDNLHILLDEEATQAGIRAAMDEMVEVVEENDVFVCFYSGHGSRMADPERRGKMLESIVPHDSGRPANPKRDSPTMPNRDIPDVEIGRWLQRLNEKTPHVTLIFDCCYSKTMARVTGTRSIEPDLRRPEEMFEDGLVPALLRAPKTSSREGSKKLPYVRGRHQAVVVAACRADEEAQEYMHREGGTSFLHGALSFFLGRALAGAAPGATWRDVFETAGTAVTTRFRHQHPQVEGNWDQVLFGTREIRATPYLLLTAVGDDAVELSGGAAHGVTQGSVWSVHPAGTRHADTSGEIASGEIASVRIESVGVATSGARVLEAESAAKLAVGQRVFLREQSLPEPGLKVRLDLPQADSGPGQRLRQLIGESPLLGEEEPADVVVRYLSPRTEVADGDPCPHLGPLADGTWAAVGEDGRLAVRTRGDHEAAGLVGDLVSRTRYDRLLEIMNTDPESRLRGRVRLLVTRRGGDGNFVAAEPEKGDGLLSFEEEEVVDFEVHNDHDEPVWITLLQLGCDGGISRLIPLRKHPTFQPTGYRLEAGEVLRLGDYYRQDGRFYYWNGVHVQLPAEGFPWAAEPGEDPGTGLVYLKLMVTLEPADFELLEQNPLFGAPETRDPGQQSHPLLNLARLYGAGRGERSVAVRSAEASPSLDWTAVTRPVALRRREGMKVF